LIKYLTHEKGLNLAVVKMVLEMTVDIDKALEEFEKNGSL